MLSIFTLDQHRGMDRRAGAGRPKSGFPEYIIISRMEREQDAGASGAELDRTLRYNRAP
jgi:hypothetical protein